MQTRLRRQGDCNHADSDQPANVLIAEPSTRLLPRRPQLAADAADGQTDAKPEAKPEAKPDAEAGRKAAPSRTKPDAKQADSEAEQLFAKGREALFQGKYDEAIELLTKAVAADKTKTSYRLHLARAYRYAGKDDQAIAQLGGDPQGRARPRRGRPDAGRTLLGRQASGRTWSACSSRC